MFPISQMTLVFNVKYNLKLLGLLEQEILNFQSQLEEKEKAAHEQVERLTEELEALRVQLKERLDLAIVPLESPAVTEQAARSEPPLLEREDGEVQMEDGLHNISTS